MESPTEPPTPSPFSLRVHSPGDMERITERHAQIYKQEYGWDEPFQKATAEVTSAFINHYDPAHERCWIAERDAEFLGCVMLVKHHAYENTARLRLLLVEPSARGLGVGRALVRQCAQFAREVGYARIRLWTTGVLASARHIYESEGYRMVREEELEAFGVRLVGQDWELVLYGSCGL
ncbi:hypothetical protein BP6252_13804 [Coleophoma cylindrospora]|uniref:N-acetyltransferase domain-containing protein n=1 Tax=Coleophoma cylindrospora TaxID=1849047 RepID=A0A3D8Q6K3_9HELO|nr:hypothetical protein BP6252_13804 [Coleophoma cylindrospora]